MSLSALLEHIVETEALQEYHRGWTEDELTFVRENLMALGYDGVAAHLGRSSNAVKIAQTRKRLPAPSKYPETYTMQQAANLLAVDFHCLQKLHRRGKIRFHILPGERGIRVITRISLWAWAINPYHWMYFKPQRVRDWRLRRLIMLRMQKWGDEWWTPGKVAEFYGLACSNTVTAAIYRGKLSARRWGNWWIRKSDALAYQFYAGKGNTQGKNFWSPRADAFILKARDEWGKTWEEIGRMMKWSGSKVAYRYKMLQAG